MAENLQVLNSLKSLHEQNTYKLSTYTLWQIMGDILQFKKPSLKSKHKGRTLCKSGFHKWEVMDTPFDVKKGKMLTAYKCTRCGKTKTESK